MEWMKIKLVSLEVTQRKINSLSNFEWKCFTCLRPVLWNTLVLIHINRLVQHTVHDNNYNDYKRFVDYYYVKLSLSDWVSSMIKS